MKHVIEFTRAPYSPSNPRRYYAADYPIGAVVDDDSATYTVCDVDGVLMFVTA
jgi:hypothetical protein